MSVTTRFVERIELIGQHYCVRRGNLMLWSLSLPLCWCHVDDTLRSVRLFLPCTCQSLRVRRRTFLCHLSLHHHCHLCDECCRPSNTYCRHRKRQFSFIHSFICQEGTKATI